MGEPPLQGLEEAYFTVPVGGGLLMSGGDPVQGYLAHKKQRPPRTLQWD